MKNLVVVPAGDESLHNVWAGTADRPFDVCVIYYGNNGDRWKETADHYFRGKGTKLHLLSAAAETRPDVFARYDAVFFPDDDLYMTTETVGRMFEVFHEYSLSLAQPSIVGWASVPITLHQPMTLLRYTNWVEVMCPCFSKDAFATCLPVFTRTSTNWGVDWAWVHRLGHPHKGIAVIDAAIAVHTRPCFYGDTYQNNGTTFESGLADLKSVLEEYGLSNDYRIHGYVPLNEMDFLCRPSENKFHPNVPALKPLLTKLRSTSAPRIML